MNDILKQMAEVLIGNYGLVAQVFGAIVMVMGVLRSVVKPGMELLKKFALSTESKSDDALVQKIEGSAAYKTFCFMMDYVLSIKVPVVKASIKEPV